MLDHQHEQPDGHPIGLYACRNDLRGRRRGAAVRSVGEIDARVWLWLELFKRLGILTAMEQQTRLEWEAETFAQVTEWEGRTNEHTRHAARLVFGRTVGEVQLRSAA